jgi:YbbR domain-containing protein
VADVRQSYPLVPRDDRGFIVEGVTLDPTSVDVEIAVEQKQFSRLVAVSPSLRGSPAGGYNVLAVEVDPASVTLLGPVDILSVTSVVLTDNIDITGVTSDVFQTVGLSLPSGVNVSGPGTVSVRVRVTAGQGEASFGVAPQWTGLAADLRLASITSLVEVRLAGDLPTLGSLSVGQVGATVDLSGLDAGTHRLEPEVEVPSGLRVVGLSPGTVEVVLSPAPESTETPTPTPTATATAQATEEPTP